MSKNIFEVGRNRFIDSAGDPLNGGKIFFYEPGTTTKKDTYPTKTDADAQTNANANPVVLDSGGLPSNAIFLRGDYKVIVTTSGDTDPPAAGLYTIDNINKPDNIIDSNGNEVIEIGATASAVNHLKVTNSAAGGTVVAEATGDDTNIELQLKSKGTDALTLGSGSATGPVNLTTSSGAITLQSGSANTTISPTSGNVIISPAAGDVTLDPSGTLTLQANSFPTADGTANQLIETDGAGALSFASHRRSKSLTVLFPGSSEDISFFRTDKAITITQIVAVLVGSSTPSVTWTLRHGTDRSAAGSEVVTSGTTTTSTTTGSVVTSFNDATIVADSFVWLETTAQSGTVEQIQITIDYTED